MTEHESNEKSIVRLITCGSVDDGKSTLIGRMLYDSNVLYEDQLRKLEEAKLLGGELDFSTLLDGLLSEQEQSITIDLAYRSFATKNRRFLIADAPGHEEYTKNMITGASQVDLAILLVDVTKVHDNLNHESLLVQTRRHLSIVELMGIEQVIIAINKMDALNYSQEYYNKVRDFCDNYAKKLDIKHIDYIPVSALYGDNICQNSLNTPWYSGKPLLKLLEDFEIVKNKEEFIFPVQQVTPFYDNDDKNKLKRALGGTILTGKVAKNQEIAILPSKKTAKIHDIFTYDGKQDQAYAGEAINLVIDDFIDIARGYVLAEQSETVKIAEMFSAKIISMGKNDLMVGRTYLCKIGHYEATATILEISAKLNLENHEEQNAKVLKNNEIGRIKFSLSRPLPFVPYKQNKQLGSFLFIDKISAQTIACGMILYDLYRSHSVVWHNFDLNKEMYAKQKNQKPFVLWFVGLSASGKSSLANALGKMLYARGKHIYQLDGDNLRHGLNKDLGFTEADRVENIRRASNVAKLMLDAGLIVLATFISPFNKDRENIRTIFAENEFIEIFLDTPIEVCEKRDPKGLYKRARNGELPNFTGISSPFEKPLNPEIYLDGTKNIEELCNIILDFLDKNLK